MAGDDNAGAGKQPPTTEEVPAADETTRTNAPGDAGDEKSDEDATKERIEVAEATAREAWRFRAIMDTEESVKISGEDALEKLEDDVAKKGTIIPEDPAATAKGMSLGVRLSSRALAAGGRKKRDIAQFDNGVHALAEHERIIDDISANDGKFLVIGDGVVGPFMALCLRAHGIECDLLHEPSKDDADRGTIILSPSVTQVLGDVMNVSVPSGSVIGRVLVFDHVGNDLCDLDLNEFREKGESPTFFACDRPKIEQSLLSLCKVGTHSCNVLSRVSLDRHGIVPTAKGVKATFSSGTTAEYRGIIVTARNQSLVPELTVTNEELQQRAENDQEYKKAMSGARRWMEVSVPPLPELGKFDKRFTPGSQEIVEILTPRGTKMSVRPTMMATKLFYNCTLAISDQSSDPRLRSTPMKTFWDETVEYWTAGIPGYVSHTMFKPMFMHMQQHFTKNRAVVYKTAPYNLPHWSEGGGRVIKVAHAVHGAGYDAIDVADAQSFSDCFLLAKTLGEKQNVNEFLKQRRAQVAEELDHHEILQYYCLTERTMFQYMRSRFMMKLMRRYITNWRKILKHYISVVPKQIPK